MPARETFLRVLKPAASPLRNPRSCRRMTGGGVTAIICRPWRGRPPSSRQSLGDPSRVDFRLVFYPLVTPLRRDDQGLLSDEASGFTSCVACDRHFLISNGSWGHNHAALHMQPPVLHTQPPIFCLQLSVLHLLPPWRLAFLESRVVSAASYPAWEDVVTRS